MPRPHSGAAFSVWRSCFLDDFSRLSTLLTDYSSSGGDTTGVRMVDADVANRRRHALRLEHDSREGARFDCPVWASNHRGHRYSRPRTYRGRHRWRAGAQGGEQGSRRQDTRLVRLESHLRHDHGHHRGGGAEQTGHRDRQLRGYPRRRRSGDRSGVAGFTGQFRGGRAADCVSSVRGGRLCRRGAACVVLSRISRFS